MKIWVLVENTSCHPELSREHGLSLYIEAGERRILFDMGQTDAFASNAQRMGVDLSRVDIAVLSHGHYDHGGGLRRFLEVNEKAKVYLSRHALRPHYNGAGAYIGIDPALAGHPRLTAVGDRMELGDGCCLLTGNGLESPCPPAPDRLQTELEGQRLPDDFCHEQYLVLEEKGKRICFTGCAHRGVQNILHWLQPDVLVGGLHLRNMEQQSLYALARELKACSTVFYAGHCTGEGQLALLGRYLGEKVKPLTTGDMICI